ncbi:hypothetical protein E2C01_042256 [Portunus trituberculatus]|uniref:Uncharacterized protein n=1 Tax=Portunus trituberculatus TaxID=210409 RepID=A0A5B7FU46_PORTR|nr:hypothetical protein [Portunus trituberculatus]
MLLIMGTSHPT